MGHFGKRKKGWHICMGCLTMGKSKNETTKSIYCHEKDEPQIYKRGDKILSFSNVQT
jgi:hypothetical protein